MRRSWMGALGVMLLLSGCHSPAPAPQVSAELRQLDADKSTAPNVLVPKLVTASLAGTPYAGQVACAYEPDRGQGTQLLLRATLPVKQGTVEAMKADVQAQLADIYGHILVPLSHHGIQGSLAIVSARTAAGNAVPVEMVKLRLTDVPLGDQALGAVVPADRIVPHMKLDLDQWNRLKSPVAAGSPAPTPGH